MISVAEERRRVVELAREWLGTPFVHAQAVKGSGVDCAQLIIAVYVEAGIMDAVTPGCYPERYTPDWWRHERRERFLEGIEGALLAVDEPGLGDLASFRYGRVVAHGGLVVGHPDPGAVTVIHALRQVGVNGVITERCGPGDELHNRLAGFWSLRRWHDAPAEEEA